MKCNWCTEDRPIPHNGYCVRCWSLFYRSIARHRQAMRWLRLRWTPPRDDIPRDAIWIIGSFELHWEYGEWSLYEAAPCAGCSGHLGEVDRRTARALLHAAEVYAREEDR